MSEEYKIEVDANGASIRELYENLKGPLVFWNNRGRPRMTEKFFYDPTACEWGSFVWKGDTLIMDGVMIK